MGYLGLKSLIYNWHGRYEKLQRWEDALKAYDMKLHQVDSPHEILECTLGTRRSAVSFLRTQYQFGLHVYGQKEI